MKLDRKGLPIPRYVIDSDTGLAKVGPNGEPQVEKRKKSAPKSEYETEYSTDSDG